MPCLPKRTSGRIANMNSRPASELEHFDAVIWLGDFNYRISSSQGNVTDMLMKKEMWDTLQSNCQLNIEKKLQRITSGFSEGTINFAPSYKFG